MATVSLRLPEELERKLSQEASLSGQPRSQLIREALEALLSRRVLASDPAACAEALAAAADFLPAENEALERAETEAGNGGADPQNDPWWR